MDVDVCIIRQEPHAYIRSLLLLGPERDCRSDNIKIKLNKNKEIKKNEAINETCGKHPTNVTRGN